MNKILTSLFERLKTLLYPETAALETKLRAAPAWQQGPLPAMPAANDAELRKGDPHSSLLKRLVLLARRKRHRKEINMFPPAKVYASGRHEVRTRHSKSADGKAGHGRQRGGRDK